MHLSELVEAAVLAPSSHNTQPWLFDVSDEHVDLYADRTRALPVNDPFDRELTISCGAALFNIRVAAAARGLAVNVTTVPTPETPDLLARVRLRPDPESQHVLAELADAMKVRFTVRAAFDERPVSEDLTVEMTRAAAMEGARLLSVTGEKKKTLATLVNEGDRVQFENPSWRRELASWMHPRRKGDGLAMSPVVAPISRLVVRHFDLGARTGATDEKLAREAPALTVFTSEGDSPREWLEVGQALQRTLLVAARDGVQAGYLNQPCQIERLRGRLGQMLPFDEAPQVVVRFGFPTKSAGDAPRRPLQDVLM